ncbi:hypothetical protein MIV011L [Invertebrate iridescent virus 3]|uniref:Uncharacterized protein 011L n=1 Tax=Invertebrate iridescent virus 3 TaxID=345201 RepID=011L_IIV3|nr:hypothetical protein MIV011L [Invertebrate iridescent virus 3]Q197E9.1 RecName: Full=Uncharacterized protein 011L [Invertebrate iridescent virus 3]ABF82041.1 hypothetical protein MIV011L [Invertebrate iridescent virus 3]
MMESPKYKKSTCSVTNLGGTCILPQKGATAPKAKDVSPELLVNKMDNLCQDWARTRNEYNKVHIEQAPTDSYFGVVHSHTPKKKYTSRDSDSEPEATSTRRSATAQRAANLKSSPVDQWSTTPPQPQPQPAAPTVKKTCASSPPAALSVKRTCTSPPPPPVLIDDDTGEDAFYDTNDPDIFYDIENGVSELETEGPKRPVYYQRNIRYPIDGSVPQESEQWYDPIDDEFLASSGDVVSLEPSPIAAFQPTPPKTVQFVPMPEEIIVPPPPPPKTVVDEGVQAMPYTVDQMIQTDFEESPLLANVNLRTIPIEEVNPNFSPVLMQDMVRDSFVFGTVAQRVMASQRVKQFFKELIEQDVSLAGRMCMDSGSPQLNLYNSLMGVKLLYRWRSSTTFYRAIVPEIDEPVQVMQDVLSSSEWAKFDSQAGIPPKMVYIHYKLLNDLVKTLICPNFQLTHAALVCVDCRPEAVGSDGLQDGRQRRCSNLVSEYHEMTLEDLFNTIKPADLNAKNIILSVLFQMLYAVATVQKQFGMGGLFANADSVHVRRIQPGGFWHYTVNGLRYSVPNYGYLVILTNFTDVVNYRPDFATTRYFGRRQAKVVPTRNWYKFVPFTTRYRPFVTVDPITQAKTTAYAPNPPTEGITINEFYKDSSDLRPSVPVDLNDMITFPVPEFHLTICRLFSFFSKFYDSNFIGNDPFVRNLVDRYSQPFEFPDVYWPEDGVSRVLACYTIEEIYPNWVDGDTDYVIESYNLD